MYSYSYLLVLETYLHVIFPQMLSTEMRRGSGSSRSLRTTKRIIGKLLRKCSANASYTNDLVKSYRYASNLFRLLTTSATKENVASLAVIAKTILECKTALERPKNPLVTTLRTFLNRNNYSEITANLSTQSKVATTIDGTR